MSRPGRLFHGCADPTFQTPFSTCRMLDSSSQQLGNTSDAYSNGTMSMYRPDSRLEEAWGI